MRTPEQFLSAPLVDEAAAAEFQVQCRRVMNRHRGWRANFPAFAVLLDTDEERSHALAGNYSTEARETIGVWLAAQDQRRNQGAAVVAEEELVAWLEGYLAAWRRQVLDTAAVTGLEGDARVRFLRVFNDLQRRAGDEALNYLRQAEAAGPDRLSLMRALLRPFRAVARGLQRFFFPGSAS